MIGVLATLAVDPEDAAPLRAALQRLAAHAAEEPGTLLFGPHEDVDHPGTFVVFEQYRDQVAVDEHRSSLAMAEFRSALRAIGTMPEIRYLRELPATARTTAR